MTLEELFIILLNMSITAGYVVIAVIILRLLLKRAPRWVSCMLWALVGLRLILPFSFESVMSLIPSASTVTTDILYTPGPIVSSGAPTVNSAVNPVITVPPAPAMAASLNPMQIAVHIVGFVWIAGMFAMLLYSVITYVRVRRRVDSAVLFRDNIYESSAVASPFVLGIIKPRIYLPFSVSESDRKYVISHEQTHIRRKDHWIKPFGFLLLTVYWFNPLIWGAYVLLCRDIEVACDEAVIKDIGGDEKKAYSLALLDCAVSRRSIAMCPLAFGEVGVKERVKNVLNYKKPAFWIVITAVAACIIAAICLLSNPKANESSYERPGAEQLFEYRTPYVGDNSAVTNILGLLDFPSDVAYDHIELQTVSEPYGVEVYFNVTAAVKSAYDQPEPANIEVFRANACIMMSLIGNADGITFRLDDGSGNPVDLYFTREWAESVTGVDLWAESDSAERLDSLIAQIDEHMKDAYAPAVDVTVEGLPTGTFTPADVVYFGKWFDVTADGFLENNKDTTYEIESGLFCDGLADYDVQYTAMDVKDAIQTFNDDDTLAVDVSGYGDKAGWRVFNADGSDTGYRIFRMDDEIWIGHWGWYGSNKDSWLCDYIFRVDSPALSDSAADNGVDTGKDLTLDVIVENFRARQYNCNVVLPGDWEGLYTISQSDYGITFYDEANADYGGCLFGIYWLTGDEAKSPWEHGIINDGCSLIKETEGGGFYAVYPYTDVEFDSEDAAKAAEYRSMLADMNGICGTLTYGTAEKTGASSLPLTANLPRGYDAYAADGGTLFHWVR